jgi:hypothetical protein
MAIDFFDLPGDSQRAFIESASTPLNKDAYILEKDLWLCLTLRELFKLPHPMSFKGGTSLSKVFNLIQRFSEDIDITLDYRGFDNDIDLSQPISRTALKKISEQLREDVRTYTHDVVLPHMAQAFETHCKALQPKIELSASGEEMYINYPSLIQSFSHNVQPSYIRPRVLIEFGGRNTIEPSRLHHIESELSKVNADIVLPKASINVLSPTRTFWEKAILMHVRSHRGQLEAAPERLSRHWYDMAVLSDSWVAGDAIVDHILMKQIVRHNMAFYHASYTHYDDCLSGNFRLLPDKTYLSHLKQDYTSMIDAGMFETEPLTFDMLLNKIEGLEQTINQSIRAYETNLTKSSQRPDNTIVLPFIEAAIEPKEVFSLINSGHEPLKQIGTLLKELLDGKRTLHDENWRFLPTILKSLIDNPMQGKHFETSAPKLFYAIKSKVNEKVNSKERIL